MKLLSADDMKIYQSKENQQLRRIKALTIKDLGVEVSPEAKQFELCLFKSPTVPDAIKNLWLTKRKAERLV